jgi:hypothetical protein
MNNVVFESMKDSMKRLEVVAERIMDNDEGIDSETVKIWKQRILHLTGEISSIQSANINHGVLDNTKTPNLVVGVDAQNIINILNKRKATAFDNSCEFVEAVFGFNDTICPFTRMTYVDPMER